MKLGGFVGPTGLHSPFISPAVLSTQRQRRPPLRRLYGAGSGARLLGRLCYPLVATAVPTTVGRCILAAAHGAVSGGEGLGRSEELYRCRRTL